MPLTVDDLAHHLNAVEPPAEGSRDRVEMQRALDSAVQEVRRMTGRIDAQTITVRVSARRGDRALRLPCVDLAAVGSVADPTGYAVAPAHVDLLSGIVELDTPTTGGAYLISVTGEPWPSALETAALDWATHMYDTQRTVTSPVSDDDQPSPTFALPNRVAELLSPYRLAAIA